MGKLRNRTIFKADVRVSSKFSFQHKGFKQKGNMAKQQQHVFPTRGPYKTV